MTGWMANPSIILDRHVQVIDLDAGLYVYRSAYWYDADIIDYYACCAFFEPDGEWCMEAGIPTISVEQSRAIKTRLKREIAAKGIAIETGDLRWHVMASST